MSFFINSPYPVFTDLNGEPLESGSVYIGVANKNPETNPVNVYYDEALTISATQPLVTLAGYISRTGTPSNIYVQDLNFSITVRDKNNQLIYSNLDVNEIPRLILESASVLENIAAMTALIKANLTDGMILNVLGYTTVGNSGGGSFRVTKSAITPDGGKLFAFDSDPTGASGGFIRESIPYSDHYINPQWYGCTGDGLTNDGVPYRAMLASRKVNDIIDHQGLIYLLDPDGGNNWCAINTVDNITIKNGTLKYTGGGKQIFRSYNADNFTSRNMTCIGPGTDGTNLGYAILQIDGGDNININNCSTIDSDADGVAIANATNVYINGHYSQNDSKSGIYVNGSVGGSVTNNIVINSGGHIVGSLPVGAGIQLSGNTDLVCDGNIIKDGIGIGIYCNQTVASQPIRNIISNNSVHNVSNSTNINTSGGIRCDNGHASKNCGTVIIGNEISECGIYSAYIENHHGFTLKNNISINSIRSGFVVGTLEGGHISGNTAVNTNTSATATQYDFYLINAANEVVFDGDNTALDISTFTAGNSSGLFTDISSGSNIRSFPRPFEFREYSTTWQPNGGANILDGEQDTVDIVGTGAVFGEYVLVSAPYTANGATVTGYVSSPGTVTIVLHNGTGAIRTYASGTWTVRIYGANA